jgi:prevent-host-death family protein
MALGGQDPRNEGVRGSSPRVGFTRCVGEVLRRAEAGERITITVSGRPVAELGPVRSRQWVSSTQLADLWATPPDPTLERDLQALSGQLADPWAGN